jgi:hypothetical protein
MEWYVCYHNTAIASFDRYSQFTESMITILDPQALTPSSGRVTVDLTNKLLSCTDTRGPNKGVVGKIINERTIKIIGRLQQRQDITLQMYCQSSYGISSRKRTKNQEQVSCELSVIVYVLSRISEAFGAFFQGCEIYLQDPAYCDRDVPYFNPQCLSSTEPGIIMTSSLDMSPCDLTSDYDPTAMFDQWSTSETLVETKDPSMLGTPLKRQPLYILSSSARY